MSSPSRLLSFTKACWGVVKSVITKFSSKFSKKTYTQHQHLAILCLMKYLKMHYRDVIDLLKETPGIRKILGLKKLPHFTTPNKFLLRISTTVLEFVLNKTANLFTVTKSIAGIDSSGYTQRHASRYYTKRCELRKTYLKNSICIDTKNQIIMTSRQSNGNSHDTLFFPSLLTRSSFLFPISNVVADKAYDSSKNRNFANSLWITPVIPYKECTKIIPASNRKLNKRIYHRRSLVETVFSVIKRKFDDTVHSTRFDNQKKEAKILDIVYNLYKYAQMMDYLLIGFLRSRRKYSG